MVAERVAADLREHERICSQRWKDATEAAEKTKDFLSAQLLMKVHELNLKLDKQTDTLTGWIKWGGGLTLTALVSIICLLASMIAHKGGWL